MSPSKTIFIITVIALYLALSIEAGKISSGTILKINKEAAQELINPKNTRLYLLGTIDGKSFFAKKFENGSSWEEAKIFCASFGMKMAKIATAAELEFLKRKYHPTNFHGDFWVGGRDARTAAQFVWDTDNSLVSSSWLPFGPYYEQLTCLYYVSVPTAPSYGKVISYPCSSLSLPSGVGVLCET